jgi:hypothetical protein
MKKLTPNRTFLYGLATGALLIVVMVSCAKAYPILPPEEYDHPFDGQLSTAVTHDLEQLAVLCGTPAVGCVHGHTATAGDIRSTGIRQSGKQTN